MLPTLITCLLLLAARASAHGGSLHPGGPEQSNYIRVKVANCSKWAPASGLMKRNRVAPAATKLEPIDVKGSVTLWQYLYGNCSYPGEDPSAGAVFNVSITRGGKPLSGVALDGLGMVGSCAESGLRPYYFNPDKVPIDDNENMLWFTNYTTKADGKVVGNGANDGIIRTVAQGRRDAVKAMVLVDVKTNSILSCCDLAPAGPATTNWTKALDGQGQVCEPESEMPAATKLTNSTNGTMAAGHDHAGHDHAGHDHSSMSKGANKTEAQPGSSGSKAKSSAGAAAARLTGAAAAAAVVLLVL